MRFVTQTEDRALQTRITQAAASEARVASLEREIARLEAQVALLRGEWKYERERADQAVDSLLASKGMRPVMPPPQGMQEPDPFVEDPKDVQKILESMGLARKGEGCAS